MTNCACDVYTTVKDLKAAIEALDDTKFLGMIVVVEDGMHKAVVAHKT